MFRRSWVTVALFALGPASCAQVLGAEDYEVATADPNEAPLPLLPARPDPDRVPGCEACVAEKCKAQRDQCLMSERCRDMLRCQGGCSNPACLTSCQDTLPRSFDFDDYFSCAFASFRLFGGATQCPEECGAGDNWACSGAYRWPGPTGKGNAPTHLHLALLGPYSGPLAALVGVEVGECDEGFIPGAKLVAGDDGCSNFVLVDGTGDVDVPLTSTRDVFAARGIPGAPAERHRFYTRPVVRPGPGPGLLEVRVIPTFAVPLLVPESLPAFQPDLGVIAFFHSDCLGMWGISLRIELTSPGTATRFYWGGEVEPGFGAAGAFYNVTPGGSVEIVGTLKGEAEPRLRRVVGVAPGWQTTVFLYP